MDTRTREHSDTIKKLRINVDTIFESKQDKANSLDQRAQIQETID